MKYAENKDDYSASSQDEVTGDGLTCPRWRSW